MIPKAYIDAWSEYAPWQQNFQVEQDMVIERALIEIFSDPFLNKRLVFRGGTALYKLFLKPQARYSEDIDLVQIKSEPIKETIDVLRERLSFLGIPIVKQKLNNNTIVFRFESESEPKMPMRLKVEINCREHFSVFGYEKSSFKMNSRWYSGETDLITYSLEELLGTKLRALYQRKKGRDLFDMWKGITEAKARPDKIIEAFGAYMDYEKKKITQKQFINNMNAKMKERIFLGDIEGLLRPGIDFNAMEAYDLIRTTLLEKI